MVTFLGFGGLAGTHERAVAAEADNSFRERNMVLICSNFNTLSNFFDADLLCSAANKALIRKSVPSNDLKPSGAEAPAPGRRATGLSP
jgi:hypothetical protein